MQDAPVLAIDIPTGLDADTGVARTPAIRATATATFIALKPGLLTHDGVDLCGSVSVHALGLDVEGGGPASGHELTWPALASALPHVLQRRSRTAHKGTFGTLAIVGGETGFVGAALLAARTAVRTGAGKVRVGFVARDYPSADMAAPETMLRDAAAVLGGDCDALVVGCGLGTAQAGRDALAKALGADVPLVLDADALNLIAADSALRERVRARKAPTLATPHPAEAARLLGCDTAMVQQDRLAACTRIAQSLGAHVVLKGAGSVLAHPDGTFDINASGNVALATAGSGDVLAGMLGALLAQKIEARDALRIGVCLHGAAADRLVAGGTGPLGVGASELPDAARALLNEAAVCARSR
jgi:ADP-dependent NAD(P)H-hydrate dehydratase / NAD(P)H-hydrate epimerase